MPLAVAGFSTTRSVASRSQRDQTEARECVTSAKAIPLGIGRLGGPGSALAATAVAFAVPSDGADSLTASSIVLVALEPADGD